MLSSEPRFHRVATSSAWKKALLAAYKAVVSFMDDDNKRNLVLVGGGALIFSGIDRSTDDLDFLGTQEAIVAFIDGASEDRRFRKDASGSWYFGAIVDGDEFSVKIEFLQKGDLLDGITSLDSFEGGFKASIQDLAIQKAIAYQGRGTSKDSEDFTHLIATMASQGLTFAGYSLDLNTEVNLRKTADHCTAGVKVALNTMIPNPLV